jgi:hypothetical protein
MTDNSNSWSTYTGWNGDSDDEAQQHQQLQQQQHKYQCKSCSRQFRDNSDLKRHANKRTPCNFKATSGQYQECDQCHQPIKTTNLQHHKRSECRKRPPPESCKQQCEFCGEWVDKLAPGSAPKLDPIVRHIKERCSKRLQAQAKAVEASTDMALSGVPMHWKRVPLLVRFYSYVKHQGAKRLGTGRTWFLVFMYKQHLKKYSGSDNPDQWTYEFQNRAFDADYLSTELRKECCEASKGCTCRLCDCIACAAESELRRLMYPNGCLSEEEEETGETKEEQYADLVEAAAVPGAPEAPAPPPPLATPLSAPSAPSDPDLDVEMKVESKAVAAPAAMIEDVEMATETQVAGPELGDRAFAGAAGGGTAASASSGGATGATGAGPFARVVQWQSRADGWGSPEDIKEKKRAAQEAAWQERVQQALAPADLAAIKVWAAKMIAVRNPHKAEQCPFPEKCPAQHRPADTY